MLRRGAILVAAAAVLLSGSPVVQAQTLDYEQFKSTVMPIFVTKRPGYTRCVVCHTGANNAMRMPAMNPGATAWNEEQARTMFETVSRVVTPGKPDESHLLLYPLVPQEGGSAYHSGGRQWPTKSDPAWQTIARWVKGEK